MSSSFFLPSHIAQQALYPTLNPAASPNLFYNGEIARHELLAYYASQNAAENVRRAVAVLHIRVSTLQSHYAFTSTSS